MNPPELEVHRCGGEMMWTLCVIALLLTAIAVVGQAIAKWGM